jgi:hypothetical protein
VLAVGETVADPDSGSGLCPTEGVIVIEVAFVDVQVRVTDCPAVMLELLTVNVTVGICGGGVVLEEFPPHATKVIRTTERPRTQRRRKSREFTMIPRKMR